MISPKNFVMKTSNTRKIPCTLANRTEITIKSIIGRKDEKLKKRKRKSITQKSINAVVQFWSLRTTLKSYDP